MTVVQSEHQTKLKEELAAPLRVMQEIVRRIAKVCNESKLPIVEEEYVQSFKVELMDAVVQWCRGASFADICKASALHENACLSTVLDLLAHPHSSQTSSREALFASSGDCKSSFDRWPRLQRSSAMLSYNKNSKKHPRCSSGQTQSSLPRHCTSRALYGRDTLFISLLSLDAAYMAADTQARNETG